MTCVSVKEFDRQRFYLLTHKIKNTKSQYDLYLKKQQNSLKGSRYDDDERIARMVLGKIYKECGCDLRSAKKKFIALNSIEIEPYIKDSILESANADYHYVYKKDCQ